jgi:hypothetical protein
VVVVFTAVGDDTAGSEKMGRGGRTGPSPADPIDQPVKNLFDPFLHAYFSIQVVFHDGIKKAFAYVVVWVIGTACCFLGRLTYPIEKKQPTGC